MGFCKIVSVRPVFREFSLGFPMIKMGTNLVLGPPEIFFRRNPSGTFRDVHWYHLDGPKKVPGAPSQGFLIFLGFDKNITKIENWLSYPHFWADF